MKLFNYLLVNILLCYSLHAQNSISLAGEWSVKLDPLNLGQTNNWAQDTYINTINLPGSLSDGGYGTLSEAKENRLTPEYNYVGRAWYQRKIIIPQNWKNKHVFLFLERVLWESVVYIDGIEFDTLDALATPHLHELGILTPGEHILAIQVNNEEIYAIGKLGHAYSEETAYLWNGIIGKIELFAKTPNHIKSVQTFSDIDTDVLDIEIAIENENVSTIAIAIEINEQKTGNQVLTHSETKSISPTQTTINISLPLSGQLALWSEFTPNVYSLKVTASFNGVDIDSSEIEFGYRKVSHDGTKIHINDKPVLLRGNLDNVHFPLTGYPAMDVTSWEKIFDTYKSYGLNHARFHSWCPPEAAFKAANRKGIYLQPEANVWIDGWMSWLTGLGYLPSRDAFIKGELNRIASYYGNHPSFTMLCIGNELGNANFSTLQQWINEIKYKDNRKIYTVTTAGNKKIIPADDYKVSDEINGAAIRGTRVSRTNWDYENYYSLYSIPVVAHEIGQWPVYPKWAEIDKYTGVLKAENLKKLKEKAVQNGIEDRDVIFSEASGAFSQLLYKYEIESFLRTKSCAGYQLLSMQDYSGQGDALVGWLDSFWDSKDITTPEEVRQFINSTVPLLRVQKYVWVNTEELSAEVEISHHGPSDLNNAAIKYTIVDDENNEIYSTRSRANILNGTVTKIDDIDFSLSPIHDATVLTIKVEIESTDFKNEWNIWVYPEELPVENFDDILLTTSFDRDAFETLENGGKVLLNVHAFKEHTKNIPLNFMPVYWSLAWFSTQENRQLGIALDKNHPLFTHFPTASHSDWQWETISNNAKAFILNNTDKELIPIVQPIDDFHNSKKLGSLFEFKVGEGKLLVCGYDIENIENPVSRQLKYSILKYMLSDDFNPETHSNKKELRALFPGGDFSIRVLPDALVLYPNPITNNEVNLDLEYLSNPSIEITLLNELGVTVLQKTIQKEDKESIITLDNLNELTSGFYFIIIKYDGKREIRKLIKF